MAHRTDVILVVLIFIINTIIIFNINKEVFTHPDGVSITFMKEDLYKVEEHIHIRLYSSIEIVFQVVYGYREKVCFVYYY